MSPFDLRVGIGYDSHEFEDGKDLFLGGVKVDFPKGLKGHSDGDVILHAITDALLGAIGEEDIGQIFKDNDPRWAGMPSEVFLREALKRVRGKGFNVVNLDMVIVAEEPKIAPMKGKIRKRIATLLEIEEERVSLKGKRPEGIEGIKGIACFCTVLLVRWENST